VRSRRSRGRIFDQKNLIRRDLCVEFFRGLALITIFVDHVPHNRWAAITQQNFGFSDAAELFVALAGFSAVLAYGRYFDKTVSAEGYGKLATASLRSTSITSARC